MATQRLAAFLTDPEADPFEQGEPPGRKEPDHDRSHSPNRWHALAGALVASVASACTPAFEQEAPQAGGVFGAQVGDCVELRLHSRVERMGGDPEPDVRSEGVLRLEVPPRSEDTSRRRAAIQFP